MAEHPARLQRVFGGIRSYPRDGNFDVNLYLNGKPVTVKVNDEISVRASFRPYRTEPVLTKRSDNGAWWMPVLEKAMGKLAGGYQRISGGTTAEGFQYLTGEATESYNTKDLREDQIWTKITAAEATGRLMVAGTPGGDDTK